MPYVLISGPLVCSQPHTLYFGKSWHSVLESDYSEFKFLNLL